MGTGGLTLFPGTPLLEEAQRGEFDPLTEKEMLEELKLRSACGSRGACSRKSP